MVTVPGIPVRDVTWGQQQLLWQQYLWRMRGRKTVESVSLTHRIVQQPKTSGTVWSNTHFTEEETDIHKGQVMFPRLHGQQVAKQRWGLQSCDAWLSAFSLYHFCKTYFKTLFLEFPDMRTANMWQHCKADCILLLEPLLNFNIFLLSSFIKTSWISSEFLAVVLGKYLLSWLLYQAIFVKCVHNVKR